jgi:hypothetical protein
VELSTRVAGLLTAGQSGSMAVWPAETVGIGALTTNVVRCGENFLYVFKGAERAGRGLAADLGKRRDGSADC